MAEVDVSFVRQLAVHHRDKLLERNKRVNDPVFASGASWSVYALDRIIMACDGDTDPIKLGLEGKPPSSVAVQEALFGLTDAKGVECRCVRCGCSILPPAPGRSAAVIHRGRGLCQPCYRSVDREGRLSEYEKKFRSRDEILEEWVILCRQGYTRRQAAERLLMKPESFVRALQRARKDGDPRALLDHVQRALRNIAG